MIKKKQLTIVGTVRDFWPILKLFDKLYDSYFVSLYKPRLKGNIAEDKIIHFGENKQSILLRPIKIIYRTYKIFRLVAKIKPKLVITHHDDANVSILPFILIKKICIPKTKRPRNILRIRNNPIALYTKGILAKVILFCYKYLYKYADTIVVQVEANKHILEKSFPNLKRKIRVIPNPYDIVTIKQLGKLPITTKYKHIFTQGFTFLHIGRLTEQKAQWYLLRSFAQVHSKHSHAQLIIIGIGELEKQLLNLTQRLQLQQNVHFVGKQENIFQWMHHADCFVLPSLREGMPNTLVEALAMNLPVIASDCLTGPRDIIAPNIPVDKVLSYPYKGKYGILVETFDRNYIRKTIKEQEPSHKERILAQQMTAIIEDENLRNKYSQGCQRVEELDIHNPHMQNLLLSL
jgi:glycosyltransferase involved in cell wall biosynthesis